MPCSNYSCGLVSVHRDACKVLVFNLGCIVICPLQVRIYVFQCSLNLNMGGKHQIRIIVMILFSLFGQRGRLGVEPQKQTSIRRFTPVGNLEFLIRLTLQESQELGTAGQNRKGWVLIPGALCCVNHWAATMLHHLSFHTNKHISHSQLVSHTVSLTRAGFIWNTKPERLDVLKHKVK